MPTENYKFPADFVWGAATSSYQIEGAVSEDGKGEDIWDVFTKEDHRIFEHHTGETACDHYHRFKRETDERNWPSCLSLLHQLESCSSERIWTGK